MNQNQFLKQRTSLTIGDDATFYGCCGLFDLCSDRDLLSLHFAGAEPFLDWLGWTATNLCIIHKEFISWIRPEYSGGVATDGYQADPCGDASGSDWGKCDFRLTDFARLRRKGPVRDITKTDVRYCEAQPRYRLDGSLVDDDREYDMVVAGEVLMQDLRRMIITGNAATEGQFDGLQQLITTGYTNVDGSACSMMDSIVVDMNGNGMAGGAGMTWNGNAIAATFNFIDILLHAYRRIKSRIKWSPTLGRQRLQVGDIIFVAPETLNQCLLDTYTCWRVCDGSSNNVTTLDSYEARTFRTQLNGGMFGDGRIWLDGFEIPLMNYDWELINSPSQFDAYLLTGQVGSVNVLEGQYNDMRTVPSAYQELQNTFYTDAGRILGWVNRDQTCVQRHIEMQPRILCWAPWAQIRFQDVQCQAVTDPLSPDPTTSYFPETSFNVPSC